MTFSTTSAALEASLAGLWKRVGTISHNIANEDTPGYQAKRIAFEDSLAQAIAGIESERRSKLSTISRDDAYDRLAAVRPQEYELEGLATRADGNNVDLINEQAELARVQMQYQAVRQRISGYYSNLQYVINGGRG